MSLSLIARLLAVQEAAAFTTTDMAQWFGVKRTAMCHWLHSRTKPYPSTAKKLENPLKLLEAACASKKFKKKLPIPLSVKINDHRDYIGKLKLDALKTLSRFNSS